MNLVQTVIMNNLPMKVKRSSSGWNSFNAPCCTHNNETRDTRGRGGLILSGEAISYNCLTVDIKQGGNPDDI